MSISIITTNVFSGTTHIINIIKNLTEQTCQDFEWVFVDAFYEINKDIIKTLAGKLKNIIHVPACPATHVGRKFHWELYNNTLLLINNKVFVRLGVYRYLHYQAIELINNLAFNNIWTNLIQVNIDNFDIDMDYKLINDQYNLDINNKEIRNKLESHCGMFSYSKDKMIEMNGNNEALLIHHWEDADLNSRWYQLGDVKMVSLNKAFLRIKHLKTLSGDNRNIYLSKNVCKKDSDCFGYAKNNHKLETYYTKEYGHPNQNWFFYNGFKWIKCDMCGAIAVSDCDKYFEFLKTNKLAFYAPINVSGVGRNLLILHEDIKKLTSLNSKIELLKSSHVNPRYLKSNF